MGLWGPELADIVRLYPVINFPLVLGLDNLLFNTDKPSTLRLRIYSVLILGAIVAVDSFLPCASASLRERKKHININKSAGLSRDWVGAQKFVYVFFSGPFLMGEKKHINKIPPKIPGQTRGNFVYVFCSLCVF